MNFRCNDFVDDCQTQSMFGGKMMVQCAFGELRFVQNLRDACTLIAVAVHFSKRCAQQCVSGLIGLFGHVVGRVAGRVVINVTIGAITYRTVCFVKRVVYCHIVRVSFDCQVACGLRAVVLDVKRGRDENLVLANLAVCGDMCAMSSQCLGMGTGGTCHGGRHGGAAFDSPSASAGR